MVAKVIPRVVAYRVRNLVNGKHYIGVTKRGLGRREHEHRYAARTGSSFLLHKAIRKYGEDNFVFEVIFDFDGDYELAMIYEAEAVESERPAYNLVPGGMSRVGPISDETRQRLRDSHKGLPNARKGQKLAPEHAAKLRGQKRTDEQRARMSAAQKKVRSGKPGTMTGRKHSEETRRKLSLAHLGKPGPWRGKKRPDVGAKISAALKGRPSLSRGKTASPEAVAKMVAAKTGKPQRQTPAVLAARKVSYAKMVASKRRPVVCLNDGKIFGSAVEAGEFYGVRGAAVAEIARGNRPLKSIKGLRFSYEVPKSS